MATFLCAFQNLHGLLLIAVPGSPLFQLALGAAGKFQQLIPVFLKEMQNAGNAGILLGFGVTKGVSISVYIMSAGPGLARQIPHFTGFVEHSGPGHFPAVMVQRHGIRRKLKAIV